MGICISKLRIHSPIEKRPSSLNSILLEKSTSASFLSTLSWLYANAPNKELPVLILATIVPCTRLSGR